MSPSPTPELKAIEDDIDRMGLFGCAIQHPDRPLRYGSVAAMDSREAVESALVVFECSERIVATETHLVCVFPLGKAADDAAVDRDKAWGDMMSRHTNAKRMDPGISIDELLNKDKRDHG